MADQAFSRMQTHDRNQIAQDFRRAEANSRVREERRAAEIQREAIRSGCLPNLAPRPPEDSREE